MRLNLRRPFPLEWLRIVNRLLIVVAAACFFLAPGLSLVRDLGDEALGEPGTPAKARRLHRDLAPRIESWARERIATARAAGASLHDVPTTEWPMFTAVFYLMATDELQSDWERRHRPGERSPLEQASGAVEASRDLILDPSHHTWVRTHWGDGYLHRENVFFRTLIIAGLTSHARLTSDQRSLAVLRDQVETLARDLDRSETGLLHDYPGECYPIDVLAAVGFIRRADPVLGTDHSEFVERAVRAFEGTMTDELGLVPFRTALPSGIQLQPSRGIGNSWVSLFAPDLWPGRAQLWYDAYERSFWQDHGWAAGFREYAAGSPIPEWTFEIDAGPVIDGFGTAASAFGIAAARRNGRFDHARTLSTQAAAVAWRLPGGTLLGPRLLSHAIDAPYLGEAAILYFHTVPPAPGVPIVTGGETPGLVSLSLAVSFGVSAAALLFVVLSTRQLLKRGLRAPLPRLQAAAWLLLVLAGLVLVASGSLFSGIAQLALAQLLPLGRLGPAAKKVPQPSSVPATQTA